MRRDILYLLVEFMASVHVRDEEERIEELMGVFTKFRMRSIRSNQMGKCKCNLPTDYCTLYSRAIVKNLCWRPRVMRLLTRSLATVYLFEEGVS